jgi:hypothetical protein
VTSTSESLAETPVPLGFEQTVLPSPNVVSLDPSSREGYLDRLSSAGGSIAETFLLNTCVRPAEVAALPVDAERDAVRAWLFGSRRTWSDEQLVPGAASPIFDPHRLGPPLARFVSLFGHGGPLEKSLFAADLDLLVGDTVLQVLPGVAHTHITRRLTPVEQGELIGAFRDEDRGPVEAAVALALVSVVPWRHMVVSGDRGMRLALLEVGATLVSLAGFAERCGLAPRPVLDYSNWTLDELLRNDGLERTCIGIVALGAPEVTA